MSEIGIVDTRNIIKLIQEKYAYDFSDYALTSYKRRLENVLQLRNLKHPDLLLNRLKDDPKIFDQFIDDISVPSTEMFRDPSLWRLLREEMLPQLHREFPNFKIWLPGSVSGDELFSLCIVLKELDILHKVQIHVTCMSNKSLELIKSGILKSSKAEVSEENYQRANGKEKFSNYIKETNGTFIRDTSLISKVLFDVRNIELENSPSGVRLVLYRNKMIYFNPTLQLRILKVISNNMLPGGTLIIGVKEFLGNLHNMNDFNLLNQAESIYKKR